MTFKLFNALNEVFKEHKEVHLRNYPVDKRMKSSCGRINKYDENTDIREIDLDMKQYPYASLYIIDGDFCEQLKY